MKADVHPFIACSHLILLLVLVLRTSRVLSSRNARRRKESVAQQVSVSRAVVTQCALLIAILILIANPKKAACLLAFLLALARATDMAHLGLLKSFINQSSAVAHVLDGCRHMATSRCFGITCETCVSIAAKAATSCADHDPRPDGRFRTLIR